MTLSAFNRKMRQLSNETGLLDKEKIAKLSNQEKNEIIDHLVRVLRGTIVTDFINEDTDIKRIQACGYLYEVKGKHFDFLCTSENKAQVNGL